MQIAKAFFAGPDNGITKRTCADAMETLANTKQGANQERWRRVAKDKAYALLLPGFITETPGEFLLKVMQLGKTSTNIYLHRETRALNILLILPPSTW